VYCNHLDVSPGSLQLVIFWFWNRVLWETPSCLSEGFLLALQVTLLVRCCKQSAQSTEGYFSGDLSGQPFLLEALCSLLP